MLPLAMPAIDADVRRAGRGIPAREFSRGVLVAALIPCDHRSAPVALSPETSFITAHA